MKGLKYGLLFIAIGGIIFAVLSMSLVTDDGTTSELARHGPSEQALQPSHAENLKQSPLFQGSEKSVFEEDGADIVEAIRADFGASIYNGHTQVKALEKLVGYLKERYPNTWEEQLQTYLELTFPEYAEQLISLYQNMASYNLWMVSEKQNLVALSASERRTLIWEMRSAFFGDVALQIWEDSLKGERVLDTLIEISESGGSQSFKDNSGLFIVSLKQAYGEEADAVIESKRQELSDRFLSVPVVQQQLKAMPKKERYAALSDFRRSIGMDDAAVSRWTVLDKTRDARRAAGNKYLESRAVLQEELSGSKLSAAITQLQDELFGSEAETIRNEEDAGYFRFERPQIIGRN